jgi:CubicO group peptidase (beta-lactamase class C family)
VRVTARLRAVQRDARVPSVTAALGRDGEVTWQGSVGFADVVSGVAASADMQYRIGSITKTFTAALTLVLASEGSLDLDAAVEEYLPGTPVGRATVRELLAHQGGLQREAATDMWASMCGPDEGQLRDSLAAARMVAEPGERWHYSNLGYAVLGLVIRDVTGRSCPGLIEERLWQPLKLTRTAWHSQQPFAVGYRVDPYDDLVHPEPDMDQGAIGVGGQLWSTTTDLLTWAHALSGRVPDVLPEPVVELMYTLNVLVDGTDPARAWGLGLMLERRGERTFAGHTGAVPGFQAALVMDRRAGTAGVALANATGGLAIGDLARDLLLDGEGAPPTAFDLANTPDAWRPGPSCPEILLGVLGRWWSEAEETIFAWRDGALQARGAGGTGAPNRFEIRDQDLLVATAGPWRGETLEVARDDDGRVRQLVWATYPMTRDPR